MISFDLTVEQRELQGLAHEFAERELRPIAVRVDAGILKSFEVRFHVDVDGFWRVRSF